MLEQRRRRWVRSLRQPAVTYQTEKKNEDATGTGTDRASNNDVKSGTSLLPSLLDYRENS